MRLINNCFRHPMHSPLRCRVHYSFQQRTTQCTSEPAYLDLSPIRHRIHDSVAAYLRHVLPDGHIVHDYRDERDRDSREGVDDGQKGEHIRPPLGFPDLLIYVDGTGYCIFVRRKGECFSPIENEVQHQLHSQGIPFAVCQSLDDVRETLAAWGVRTKKKQPNNYRRLQRQIVVGDVV